jgi:hypothetical protein
MDHKPVTKKEFYREMHRYLGRKQADRDHKAQRKNLVVSSRGEMSSEGEDKGEDWQTKLQSVRGSLSKARSRSRSRGRAFAR